MGKLIQVLGTWINMQHHDNCNPSKVIYSQNKKKNRTPEREQLPVYIFCWSLQFELKNDEL